MSDASTTSHTGSRTEVYASNAIHLKQRQRHYRSSTLEIQCNIRGIWRHCRSDRLQTKKCKSCKWRIKYIKDIDVIDSIKDINPRCSGFRFLFLWRHFRNAYGKTELTSDCLVYYFSDLTVITFWVIWLRVFMHHQHDGNTSVCSACRIVYNSVYSYHNGYIRVQDDRFRELWIALSSINAWGYVFASMWMYTTAQRF